ncbi:hypothetical protein SEA_LUMOS_121 [Mycobacterium phage Lumos]|uniref:Uncharacterized protein n=1 Tax=Mycobacterium phage Lumos TaxID=1701852 RepID=A0A0K2CM71_9CAUD|nr:hypothetical protein AVU96_gp069 [Mycobacterium phage Snenia]YP_010012569.1 hypothetical protein J4T93_gp067 [Mycobacterium phage Lumos]ASM62848.1 hypothetical protein SEA_CLAUTASTROPHE_120 [Mycobacterium phage Clautastrophe]QDF16695.1 hypothetical protein PBI_MSGREEN_122 [Mycobacterium phage MsGreen]QPL14995.1 hypothetical protein SEA_JUBIE_121 [Mycobacterium phage Jubie]ALA06627.1 hypothetical protein SEA_LUMOS_121 [Mycobacterium phage Lumos]ALF01566.1 hypothetical protein SNENIA_120 [My
MAKRVKTIGVGVCRVCAKGKSLLKTHICPECRELEVMQRGQERC